MALDTYANLQTSVAGFLNRTDLTAAVPDFITLAEAQLARRLAKAWQEARMLPRAMVTRNAAFSIDAEMVSLPTDFLGPLAFSIDSEAVQLRYVRPDTLAHEKARRGTDATTATPAAYSIVGAQFQFLPSPDATYTGTLVYWQKFTALSVSNVSNWILASHPDVYLYGALTAAAPYLMDDARVAVWGALFTAGIEEMLAADPLPNDGALLRVDLGLIRPRNRNMTFDINTGDFV
jgi:hypothetical protein